MASGPAYGGLEKHFVELCNGLSQQHQVQAIAHKAHRRGMSKAVDFQAMDLTFSRRSPLNFFRLHRALKKFQPDIIHAHANKAASMISALGRFYPARTVGTVHGFKSNNRSFRNFDTVIAVSPAIYEHINIEHARVICNGIPLKEPPPHDPQYFVRQFGLTQERPVVVAVGRLADVKGFDGLIKAWPGIDADLLIVGEGPERESLVKLIEELNLSDRVQLTGYRDDVPAIMAHSDLVVISSEREGFPYVMVEALHLEKPIVATNFPGAETTLPHQHVVEYGRPVQLRAAVQAVLSSPEQAAADYQSSWQAAKQKFTVEAMVEQTNDIYRQFFRAAA